DSRRRQGRAEGREAAGRRPRAHPARDRDRVSAARHPGARRSRRQRTDAAPGRPRPRSHHRSEMDREERSGHDARPRHHAEGRRGGGAGRSGGRGGDAGRAGRARGHQEGQEGRSARRREGREKEVTVKAIVGLGNPGPEYRGTRHNVGFQVVEELTRRWRAALKKWKAIADYAIVKDRGVALVEPRTFMNASGQAVAAGLAYYKILPA